MSLNSSISAPNRGNSEYQTNYNMSGKNIPFIPFYLSSAILFIFAIAIWRVAYVWDKPFFPSWQLMCMVGLLITLGSLVLVWPFILRERFKVIADLPELIHKLECKAYDADSITRVLMKNKMGLEMLYETIETSKTDAESAFQEALSDIADVKAMNLELQEIRREMARINHKIENWQKTAIEYSQYLGRMIDIYAENEDKLSVINKINDTHQELLLPLGFKVISPNTGDSYREALHIAEKTEHRDNQEMNIVLECLENGYMAGEEIILKATVKISI